MTKTILKYRFWKAVSWHASVNLALNDGDMRYETKEKYYFSELLRAEPYKLSLI